jgi:hypothetical protein
MGSYMNLLNLSTPWRSMEEWGTVPHILSSAVDADECWTSRAWKPWSKTFDFNYSLNIDMRAILAYSVSHFVLSDIWLRFRFTAHCIAICTVTHSKSATLLPGDMTCHDVTSDTSEMKRDTMRSHRDDMQRSIVALWLCMCFYWC